MLEYVYRVRRRKKQEYSAGPITPSITAWILSEQVVLTFGLVQAALSSAIKAVDTPNDRDLLFWNSALAPHHCYTALAGHLNGTRLMCGPDSSESKVKGDIA